MTTDNKNAIVKSAKAELMPCSQVLTQHLQRLTDKNQMQVMAEIKNELRPYSAGGIVKIDKCLDEGTQLSVWSAQHDKSYTAKMIVLLITDLVNSINIARPMSEYQITQLAIDIVNELWWARMEEIAAVLEGMKRGNYQKIYERLDAQIFWSAWEVYMEDRMERVEERQQNKQYKDPTITQKDNDTRDAGRAVKFGVALGNLSEQLKDHFKK